LFWRAVFSHCLYTSALPQRSITYLLHSLFIVYDLGKRFRWTILK
jgi:hypothetical protein